EQSPNHGHPSSKVGRFTARGAVRRPGRCSHPIRPGRCQTPVPHHSWEGRVDTKIGKLARGGLSPGASALGEQPTTPVSQRYLDALPGDATAEPAVRELLEQAADRLRLLCGTLLHKSYPRLARPPVNLETDELLGGVVAGLLAALRTTRPQTVRQFFAL